MNCPNIKREGESCTKNNKCEYPACILMPDEGRQGKRGKKNINTNGLQPKKYMQQVLHKTHVMRWVEFEKQKPMIGDYCLFMFLKAGNHYGSLVSEYKAEPLFIEMMEGTKAKWLLLPPIA